MLYQAIFASFQALSLSPMPTHVMMDILAMFLSTPRSQEQTLTFNAMDIGSIHIRCNLPLHYSTQGTLSNEIQVFEDSILQLKSREFCECLFGPSFMNSLLSLPPLRISTTGHFFTLTNKTPYHLLVTLVLNSKHWIYLEQVWMDLKTLMPFCQRTL